MGTFCLVVTYLQQKHRDFHLTHSEKKEALRMLNGQVIDGKLFRGIWKDSHWVTCAVIETISKRSLTYAINNGTGSWDRTVFTAFGLIFAAMSNRESRRRDHSWEQSGIPHVPSMETHHNDCLQGQDRSSLISLDAGFTI
ncbi:uncharacterized protein BDV17DRAFT_258257 [Aspergillus undulatus]|uniref:uncharacterized protein n=1 Tax=Aspergillus undulatus TaxID=1810928 RepID=UPI003CCD7559